MANGSMPAEAREQRWVDIDDPLLVRANRLRGNQFEISGAHDETDVVQLEERIDARPIVGIVQDGRCHIDAAGALERLCILAIAHYKHDVCRSVAAADIEKRLEISTTAGCKNSHPHPTESAFAGRFSEEGLRSCRDAQNVVARFVLASRYDHDPVRPQIGRRVYDAGIAATSAVVVATDLLRQSTEEDQGRVEIFRDDIDREDRSSRFGQQPDIEVLVAEHVGGLLKLASEKRFEARSKVLLMHLGGTPAVHAYANQFDSPDLTKYSG